MGWGEDGSLEGKGVSPKESSELHCVEHAVAYPYVLAKQDECWGRGGVVSHLFLSHRPLVDFVALGQVVQL